MFKLKNLLICLSAGLMSANDFADELNVSSGIKVLYVNGKEYKEGDDIELRKGKNQFVLKLEGRFKKGVKPEYLSTVPYVAMFDSQETGDVGIDVITDRVSAIKDRILDNEPLYTFTVNNKSVTPTEQLVLPAENKVLPYMDIAPLVVSYNLKNELGFYSDADAVTLQQLGGDKKQVDSAQSEASVQLRLWYLKASKAERKEFKKWMIDQE